MTDNNNSAFCPQEAELIGNKKVVASVFGSRLGASLLNGARKRIIATESHIIIFDPKENGSAQAMIPYAELTGVNYTNRKGTLGTFTVNTQSEGRSIDIDNAEDSEAINLIEKLKEVIEQISRVPVPLTNINRLLSKSWGFHAPPQLADMTKPIEMRQEKETA